MAKAAISYCSINSKLVDVDKVIKLNVDSWEAGRLDSRTYLVDS